MLLADIEQMITGGFIGIGFGLIFLFVVMIFFGQLRLAKKVDKILENQNGGGGTDASGPE
tara:strand:+ start:419 stop:598 length:180 start_codon:yes stop_codon:yes gene_type:complete